MAIGVDTSKWKPRKIKGTPAAKFRNALGLGVLTVGIISGCLFHFAGITTNLKTASEKLYEDPIEEVERRILIGSTLTNYSGSQFRAMLADKERIDRPDR